MYYCRSGLAASTRPPRRCAARRSAIPLDRSEISTTPLRIRNRSPSLRADGRRLRHSRQLRAERGSLHRPRPGSRQADLTFRIRFRTTQLMFFTGGEPLGQCWKRFPPRPAALRNRLILRGVIFRTSDFARPEKLLDLVGLAMGASADELAPETANTGAKPAWAGRATKAASCATDVDAPAKTRSRHRAATTKHKAPKR